MPFSIMYIKSLHQNGAPVTQLATEILD